jgi:hypothetical protein
VPSRKTGLGQSSLTGLGSDLAQNSDPDAVPSSRSVWSSGALSEFICCTAVSLRKEAIVTRGATIKADLQDPLEVSFHDSVPFDSWRRFSKPSIL